jgi:hypothetical protein
MVDETQLKVVLFDTFWQIVSFIATFLYSKTIPTVPEFRGENDVCVNIEAVKQSKQTPCRCSLTSQQRYS